MLSDQCSATSRAASARRRPGAQRGQSATRVRSWWEPAAGRREVGGGRCALLAGCGGHQATVSPPAGKAPAGARATVRSQARTFPALAEPVGRLARSAPVDFGLARLLVPKGWSERDHPGLPYGATPEQNVVVSWPKLDLGRCSTAEPGDWVLMTPAGGPPPAGATQTRVNGLVVWASVLAGGICRYSVPVLDSTVVAAGVQGRAVQASVEPSALATVLATHYPVGVPAGWRSASCQGVGFSTTPTTGSA